jgi:hypothetical protein
MKAMRSRTLASSLGLLAGLAPASALVKIGDPAGVTGAVQGEVRLQSPARQTGNYDVSKTLDLASRDFNGSINIFAAGTSIGTINGSLQLLHNPFENGFSNLSESGAVITTSANDTISVDYSISPSQVDTAVVYVVNPTFGGPVTLSGSGPAPIVP